MRILTNSKNNLKGLIAISEAQDDGPQTVFFCIPIDKNKAERINTLVDFVEVFNHGISTKIMDYGQSKTINLDFEYNFNSLKFPKFTTKIKGLKVDFHLSKLNLTTKEFQTNSIFDFDFYYMGNKLNDLTNYRFIILEPNWKQLDELFIKEDIVFVDWTL